MSMYLVFTTTGGMGKECLMYHSHLAQLIVIKKGEQYAKTISWIRTRTSCTLLRSELVCRVQRKSVLQEVLAQESLYIASRTDYSEFPKKLYLPIGQVENRIH